MVVIQRKSVNINWERRSSSSSIAFGGDDDVGLTSIDFTSQTSNRYCKNTLSDRRRKNRGGEFCRPMLTGRLYVLTLITSWISAMYLTHGIWRLYSRIKFEERQQMEEHEMEQRQLLLEEKTNAKMKANLSDLTSAWKIMKHESRTAIVLDAAGEDISGFTQHDVVTSWLEDRQRQLKEKVKFLQNRISVESRSKAIEKFGQGPHRVKFTVHFIEADKMGSFVVEMASLDLMPHSVNMFLNQVDLRLWDNTVFWHYDGIDHIITSAAVLYSKGDTKHHYFEALGLKKLSFAEYSPEYPHEQFTIGFAGRGPTFYINMLDNTKLHGPGGQKNRAGNDPDPCFGKIVEGLDTIRSMYKLQLRQSAEAEKKHDWHEDELTKIVKAEILK